MKTFGDLVQVTKGRKPAEAREDRQLGDRQLIQIDDLRPGARQKYGAPEASDVMVVPADLVIAWDGANAGTSSFGLEGAIGSTLARLRLKSPELALTAYLGHFLRFRESYLRYTAKGATVPHINPSALAALEINLPTLDVQRDVVALLDRAEAIRASRRAALAQVESLPSAVFQQMFGSVQASTTVLEIATSMRTGPFGSDLLHSEFVDDGIPVLGLDNVVENEFRWAGRRYITEEKYDSLKRYTVNPGDVLVSIMGTTGRCVVVPEGIPTAINTKHICATTVDRRLIEPEFLRAAFLWHPDSRAHLVRQTKGSIMNGLNMGIIKAMPVPLPRIDHQRAFVERVARIDADRELLRRALAADEELFASLQSRAFSGAL